MSGSLFRDFLYYDDRTIDSYLSAVEGGLYDTEDHRTRVNSAGVTPDGIEVSPDLLSSSDSRVKTLHQTPAARFSRLVEYIESGGGLKIVRPGGLAVSEFADDDESFFQIKGVVEVSPVVSAVMNAAKFQAVGNVMRTFSRLGLGEVQNDDFIDKLGALNEAREALGDKVSVVMNIGDENAKFVLPLRTELAQGRFNELEGRVTVLGRVADVVPKTGRYTLIDVPGRPVLSRQQRRQAEKAGNEDKGIVRGPLVVLHVLAVYR
ncbi:hypothetical protein [Lentzea sp. NPDC060358]|uniref:DUF6414 family protein n=1 Tax=Lentzea sp. NPDC060358 TaxID=3347103 RepID=UPI00365A438F